ncbi:MAG: tetratricopeptide repeat protein [Chitinispirillaceae bacterium]|nr:tetratricopeptide repeat protein [Chitinispirillaceae bacterium]
MNSRNSLRLISGFKEPAASGGGAGWLGLRRWCLTGALLFFWTAAVDAGPVLDSANALYTRGKLTESVAMYKKALSAGENPVLCYYNCANAYFQLDSLARALAFYRQCINTAPDFVKARLNLAIIYYMLGDLGKCIAASKQTLRMEPDNRKMRLVLAAAFEKSGAVPEAAAEYEFLANNHPDMVETYLALGEIYRRLNDYETAVRWLGEYPHTGQHYPYVLLLIADIYDQAGDLPRTLFYLQKSFEKDTKEKYTFFRIVQVHKRMGNDFVALETAMEGMRLFPDFPDLALEAGNIAFNRGQLEQAEFCYGKAYALGSPGAVVGLENVKIVRAQKALGPQEGHAE